MVTAEMYSKPSGIDPENVNTCEKRFSLLSETTEGKMTQWDIYRNSTDAKQCLMEKTTIKI